MARSSSAFKLKNQHKLEAVNSQATIFGCVLLVLNAVTLIHHNHTKTEDPMVNIVCGELFADSVISGSTRADELIRR